jgi:hypothetical protein
MYTPDPVYVPSMSQEERDCDPQYRLTFVNVTEAVLKALKERHIAVPPAWEGVPGHGSPFVHMMGVTDYSTSPVRYTMSQNKVGFLIPPEQHSDIWIIGTATAPCKGSSDGSIIVNLMIWETRVVDGKRFPYGMITEVKGSGDVSQKGLDDAMRKAFDAANLDKYNSSGPPS